MADTDAASGKGGNMRKKVMGLALVFATALTLFGAQAASAGGRMATLNVVHGIPGLNVDVCVNGAKAISDFEPGDVVAGVKLAAATYHLGVVAAGDPCSAEVLAADATLKGGRNYTAIANLDASGTPNLKLFWNNIKPVQKGNARIVVRHTAEAPAVNVWANGSKIIGHDWFRWGKQKGLQVPKGIYAAWVSLPGDYQPVIGPAVLNVSAGYAYQVYAWGSAGGGYALAVVPVHVGTV
jgi:Domain of unknown function (DUF4397)